MAGQRLEILNRGCSEFSLLRLYHNSPRKRVLTEPLEGIGLRDQLINVQAVRRNNVGDDRLAPGNGTGLVQRNGTDFASLLEGGGRLE